MKIVYLAAGAAGMYCGSCLHDNTLAAALRALGEDVALVPTYTPLRTDEEDQSERTVLFGGINVYLQEKLPLLRHTPRWLDRWLDAPWLLNLLSRAQLSVDAAKLGGLTVSMLRGEQGHQAKEIARLVDWLRAEGPPEVVHLSNALLIGMAREIGRQLDRPVVCSLSGEDIFLDKLLPEFQRQAQAAMRERAGDVAAYVALNQYYADHMSSYLGLDRRRVHVIPHGLKLAGHGTRRRAAESEPFTIGYFARICPDKGLHHLVDAFRLLAGEPGLPPLRLKIAGYLGAGDRSYAAQQQSKLRRWGLAPRVEFHGELSRPAKIAFLQSLDVMCVPTVYRESKGLSILEALANAVPVVLPRHGAFPEVVADTQGGLLHEPEDPADLARVLAELILDPGRAADLGRRGQQAIHARFTDRHMAQRHQALYHQVCQRHRGEATPPNESPRTADAPSPGNSNSAA